MLNKGKNVEADSYRLCDTSTSLSTSSTGVDNSTKSWLTKNPTSIEMGFSIDTLQ